MGEVLAVITLGELLDNCRRGVRIQNVELGNDFAGGVAQVWVVGLVLGYFEQRGH